jgi:hypothetical protein
VFNSFTTVLPGILFKNVKYLGKIPQILQQVPGKTIKIKAEKVASFFHSGKKIRVILLSKEAL